MAYRNALFEFIDANQPLEVIKAIVRENPSVLDGVNNDSWNPLHCAAAGRHPLELVRFLAEHDESALWKSDDHGTWPPFTRPPWRWSNSSWTSTRMPSVPPTPTDAFPCTWP
jgi:hypothetical protein